jgi:peptidyl-prolyl cis-trans isomerase NIMA-interacting 1
MQPEFEQAAFKLQVGEISPIVSSQSGLHLIERVA